jgi:hypothetical protein
MIRTGHCPGNPDRYNGALAPEHPVWVEFARALAPIGAFLSTLRWRASSARAPAAP